MDWYAIGLIAGRAYPNEAEAEQRLRGEKRDIMWLKVGADRWGRPSTRVREMGEGGFQNRISLLHALKLVYPPLHFR